MWSVKYTGYQGVVKDTYQRICLRMTALDLLDPVMFHKVYDLVSAYMLRHVLLEIDLKDSSLDYRLLRDNCSVLKDLTLAEEKLIFTCEVANFERDNTVFKEVMNNVKPTVVLLKRGATRNKTLTMMKYLSLEIDNMAEETKRREQDAEVYGHGPVGDQHMHDEREVRARPPIKAKAPVIPVALGVSCLLDEERQYILDAHRGTIRAMCLGPVSFPNLLTCIIDLLHSRECNTYVTLNNLDDEPLKGLGKFAKKYNRSVPSVLGKVLLDLGAIVCVDRALIDHEGFYDGIMRLAHPFTHLQVRECLI